jgi:hypothetical protein
MEGEMPPTVKEAPVDLGSLQRKPCLQRMEMGSRRAWRQALLSMQQVRRHEKKPNTMKFVQIN